MQTNNKLLKRHNMKNLIEPIKSYFKKVFSDLHNAIVGAVVAAVILSGGGIYLYARQLWIQLKNIVQSPTPIWATICGILGLLVYIRFAIFQTRKTEVNQSLELPPINTKIELPNEQVEILKLLFKQDNQQAEDISSSLNTELQLAKFHINELIANGMLEYRTIRRQQFYTSTFGATSSRQIPVSVLTIIQPGRKYLIENGIA